MHSLVDSSISVVIYPPISAAFDDGETQAPARKAARSGDGAPRQPAPAAPLPPIPEEEEFCAFGLAAVGSRQLRKSRSAFVLLQSGANSFPAVSALLS